MGRGGGVHNQRLDVSDVGQKRKESQLVDPIPGLLLISPNIKGEDRGTAIGQIFPVKRLLNGVPGDRGMTDKLDFRAIL